MLSLNGLSGEIIESIPSSPFLPSLQTTGDLEGATKNISATSAPGSGTAPDYGAPTTSAVTLTLPKSTDSRLAALCLGFRLSVTRDSGSSGNLFCTVTVDSTDPTSATGRIFNAVDVQAAPLVTGDFTSGSVFTTVGDGASHTYRFWFWCNSGTSVVSLVQLWACVGTGTGTSGTPVLVASLTYTGMVSPVGFLTFLGTGSANSYFTPSTSANDRSDLRYAQWTGLFGPNATGAPYTMNGTTYLYMWGTVTTDLVYIRRAQFVCRKLLL